jgi:two-component system, OmpR family, sensor histidine kinase SenX3
MGGRTLGQVIAVDSLLVWVAGAAVVALLVGLVIVTWRARRNLARRLATASLRLEPSPPADEPRGVEKNLRRLERAVDQAALRATDTSASETRLMRAVEIGTQGLVICDDAGEVVYRNQVAVDLTTGRHGEALVRAAVDELLATALEGTPDRRALDLFGPPRRSFRLTSRPLDDERKTVGAVVVIDDLTERRRLEAVRRDFVANISHELKTPVGALGLLAETIADEPDAAVAKRLAERMLYEATRVGRTIDDLLELSRIEAEEPHPREPIAVNLVVAEAVERIRPAAEYRGTPIAVAEAPKSATVLGDRRQLVSAVHNLLDNATKYSEAGAPIEVVARVAGHNVEIAVRDHGVGIPKRDLERIFERFYRVDRARSRETGGTGLGLAIVNHVAGNHGGSCRVESREGEGSEFTLVLPAGPGVAQSPRMESA